MKRNTVQQPSSEPTRTYYNYKDSFKGSFQGSFRGALKGTLVGGILNLTERLKLQSGNLVDSRPLVMTDLVPVSTPILVLGREPGFGTDFLIWGYLRVWTCVLQWKNNLLKCAVLKGFHVHFPMEKQSA